MKDLNQRYTLQAIATKLNLELFIPRSSVSNAEMEITGIAPIESARAGQISFLDNSKYQKFLSQTQASAVVIAPGLKEHCHTSAFVSKNPYLDYARIAELFEYVPVAKTGIHPSAIVADSAKIDSSASIGPNVVIEDEVVVGPNVVIKANSTIGYKTTIGQNTIIWSNVAIFYGVSIGESCEIYSGAVIGSDGFGNAQTSEGHWHKVPQLGSVEIGNNVSIGSNTTVDRGSTGNTVIENGAKLDNQIQIAHNVRIGAHTAIAGCVAIAGSTVVGKHCQIGGGAGLGGHLSIADFVGIAGMSMITKSITQPGHYIGRGFSVEPVSSWMKFAAKLKRLVK